MRHILFITFLCFTVPAWAVINTPEVSESLVMAEIAQKEQNKEYKSKRYTVKEETDVVEKALNVFKNKGKSSSLYRKNIWLYSTLEDDSASYISFTTNDQNTGIVFSPDEEFVYYIETTPDGERRLNGIRISTQEPFFNTTASGFFIETCEGGQNSYVIVTDDDPAAYRVFSLEGESIVLPDAPADIDDLKNIICH